MGLAVRVESGERGEPRGGGVKKVLKQWETVNIDKNLKEFCC